MRAFFQKHFVIVIAVLFFFSMTQRVWFKTRAVIWSDAEGYYNYNPAVFILGGIHHMPAESLPMSKNEKGENFNKYTYGVALLQMPFFLATRAFCLIKDQQPNEIFSIHYGRAVAVAGYFWGFAGLFFLERAMRRRYSWMARFITICTLFLGTNLHYYMTKESGMSHAYSFFLFAVVVWLLPCFYENPTKMRAVGLGSLVGLIVLIRPTSILILLFVLAYDATKLRDIWDRFIWWLRQPKLLSLAALSALAVWLPQMYYWHEITGKFFMYSYQGESFEYWKQPKIAAVLFDTQNGLFLFSPLVFFIIIAIWLHRKDQRTQVFALAPIFVLSTYIFASWWRWNFGGAFGHRSYIEFYALYALSFGVLVERVFAWKRIWAKVLVGLFWAFLCFYATKLSYMYSHLYGPWEGPEWRWSWKNLLWLWEHVFK